MQAKQRLTTAIPEAAGALFQAGSGMTASQANCVAQAVILLEGDPT
jgi:hypothetical protein